MQEIKIIHEPTIEEPFLIIDKPRNLPSAPIKEGDENNAVFYACKMFPKISEVHGRKEIEKGLFHRLDTKTEGLLLFAETQEFFDYLMEVQKTEFFIKGYTAICDENKKNAELLKGYPLIPDVDFSDGKKHIISSCFRKFGKNGSEVRPVNETSGKAACKKTGKEKTYSTEISISRQNGIIKSSCSIKEGFRHQVRSHLSWIGYPVQGDDLYNELSKNIENQEMKFYATSIAFPLKNGKAFSATKDIFIQ